MLQKSHPIEAKVRLDAFRDVPDSFLVYHERVVSDGYTAYSGINTLKKQLTQHCRGSNIRFLKKTAQV